MCTATTRRPCSLRSSRHWETRGMFSLHIPQLTDQKWTSVGWPFTSASAWACVPLNHSVAPSSDGISVPILIPIIFVQCPMSNVPNVSGSPCQTQTLDVRHWTLDSLLRVQRFLTGLPFSLAKSTRLQRLNHAQRLFG